MQHFALRLATGGTARVAALLFALLPALATAQADPLPSWINGATKSRIVAFVEAVTKPDGKDFVPPAERIAVFDNDGTLWSEQPVYFQLAFALDRVRELAPQHPEWKTTEPFRSVLAGDSAGVAAGGEKAVLQIAAASHAGNTSEEFGQIVSHWLATARHPGFKRPYDQLVFQPMLELLDYLRANGFRTYLVSGGGIEFMRVFAERVYGVPPEQVIGSSIETDYQVRGDKPVIVRLPEIDFIADKAGKPVAIHKFIGRRPIAAFGNSDGDFQMLEWSTSGPGRRLGVIVHHTDAEREFAYDRDSHVGRLARGLDEAASRGWTVVDMKNDWSRVYPRQD